MFQRILLPLLGLLLICSACGETPGVTPVQPTLSPQAIPADFLISLERTGCFGECPIYTVKVSADGTVNFEGKQFVKTIGKVKGSIEQNKLRQLIMEVDKIDYFNLKDKYDNAMDGCPIIWTDNETAIISIKMNGRSKTISHYYGCREEKSDRTLGTVYPLQLFAMEKRIDEIVGTRQWRD